MGRAGKGQSRWLSASTDPSGEVEIERIQGDPFFVIVAGYGDRACERACGSRREHHTETPNEVQLVIPLQSLSKRTLRFTWLAQGPRQSAGDAAEVESVGPRLHGNGAGCHRIREVRHTAVFDDVDLIHQHRGAGARPPRPAA